MKTKKQLSKEPMYECKVMKFDPNGTLNTINIIPKKKITSRTYCRLIKEHNELFPGGKSKSPYGESYE